MKKNIIQALHGSAASALQLVCVASLALLLVLLTAGMIIRVVPDFPSRILATIRWIIMLGDDLIELAFAVLVFLGAAAICRDRATHFRVDLIPSRLENSKMGSRGWELAVSLVTLLFFLVFTYEGWLLVRNATDLTPMLVLPKRYWYLIMPVSGVIMIAYTVRDIANLLHRSSAAKQSGE